MCINYNQTLSPVCLSPTDRVYLWYVYQLQLEFTTGMFINYNLSLTPVCLLTTARVYYWYVYQLQLDFTSSNCIYMYINYNQSLPPVCTDSDTDSPHQSPRTRGNTRRCTTCQTGYRRGVTSGHSALPPMVWAALVSEKRIHEHTVVLLIITGINFVYLMKCAFFKDTQIRM